MFVERLRRAALGLCLPLCLLSPVVASAGAFDSIYVFGDSLSDGGSDLALSSSIHAVAPSFPLIPGAGVGGHFSSGPVAVEYLASALGLPLTPHYLSAPFLGGLTGGTNYAQGGASSGLTNAAVPGTLMIGPNTVSTGFKGVLGEVGDYLAASPVADPNALYVVWGGSNDILYYGMTPVVPSCATSSNPFICSAVTNTTNSIAALLAAGAHHILVPNLPDIGKTPTALAGGPIASAQAEALSIAFNTGLATALAGLGTAYPGDIVPFDTFSFFTQVIGNPSAYGFSDVTDACLSGSVTDIASTVTAACAAAGVESYLFFDGVHPTTHGQQLLAGRFAAALGVPEPSEIALIALGVFALASTRRRRAR